MGSNPKEMWEANAVSRCIVCNVKKPLCLSYLLSAWCEWPQRGHSVNSTHSDWVCSLHLISFVPSSATNYRGKKILFFSLFALPWKHTNSPDFLPFMFAKHEHKGVWNASSFHQIDRVKLRAWWVQTGGALSATVERAKRSQSWPSTAKSFVSPLKRLL